jgi:hypothetical protein
MIMKRFLLAVALGTAAMAGSAQAQLKFNPNQVAILRWYQANQSVLFDFGMAVPSAVAFDGANLWVLISVPGFGNFVVKVRAGDGAAAKPFPVGHASSALTGIAFDGANLWVVDHSNNNVYELRASDGSFLRSATVGHGRDAVAFDGASIWVTNSLDNTVTRLRTSDGTLLGTYVVGKVPTGVAFDGANLWVVNDNDGDGAVTKLRASDGAKLGSFVVGNAPVGWPSTAPISG